MKKIILLTAAIFCCLQFCILLNLQAQTLYGTTPRGGDDGGGAIIKFLPATNSLTVPKSLEGNPPENPQSANFVQADDGKLYGTTLGGGNNGYGAIFSFDPASSILTTLKNFDLTNGSHPSGSLMQARDGKVYGMTIEGGSNYDPQTENYGGVIFSFDPATSVYLKLYDLHGELPFGNGFVQASDGKLYGMTARGRGGAYKSGTIFSFDPTSLIFTNLWNFDPTMGVAPVGSLVQASDGKLYGTTSYGGSKNPGIIFSFDPSSSTFTKLKDFGSTVGRYPAGSLIQASDGKLYGTTQNGGSGNGVIFSFDPTSSVYTKLKNFDGVNGANPSGSLIQATDGRLYGTTSRGGANSVGVIFSFDPLSSGYSKLKDFDTNDGIGTGSLIQATDGKLYGVTTVGGSGHVGVIFSFDPSSSAYIKLKDFGVNETGTSVSGSLTKAVDGKLYGMTYGGGSYGYGVIFSFIPSSYTYTKLKDFDGVNGSHPYGSLTQANDGKLYGMTSEGGNGYGVIFSLDPLSSTYTKLKDFDKTNGEHPYGSLLQASDGKLYGMTYGGGSGDGAGVIFSFDPSSSTYKKLKDFNRTNGASPFGSLIQASNGKLYGMTSYGGSTNGVIFSFDPSSSTFKKLKDFDGVNGSQPYGSLVQANDGKLYGTTYWGGSDDGAGVIFSFDLSSSIYTKLKDFDYINGFHPNGALIQASDGKLYGMTTYGGSDFNPSLSYGYGVIFSFDPSSSAYTKLKDFDYTNGASPSYGSAFIEVEESNKSPMVNIVSPALDTTYLAPARIKLNAAASDDGSITKVEFYNGNTLLHAETEAPYNCIIADASVGDYTITAKAYDNDGNVTTSAAINITVVPDKAPTVNITSPVDGASYPGPANIILSADADDEDGRILKVEFYNGNNLLFTETAAPYYRKWFNVPVGNYSITARATDNNGVVTTSAAVNISVVPDKAPIVKITSPVDGANYAEPASIELAADASDEDGTIRTVDFYNGNTLLFTEKYLPYSNTWLNVSAGNYSITAVATDNNGMTTISSPVAISVGAVAKSMARGRQSNILTKLLSLNINPNPVSKTLHISIEGLQTNSKSAISVLSVSGVVIKTIQYNVLNKNVQLDISSLSAGVYYIKLINGDRILYKQFVKL